MIINHNMSAMYANRNLSFKTSDVNGNIEKLSSGMRINRAGDDASGLAVSEKPRSQIRGLNQAVVAGVGAVYNRSEKSRGYNEPLRILYIIYI
jgi:flagellin-like hook-associated protein FlgL